MKSETLRHDDERSILPTLIAISITMGILVHWVFLLLAAIFAVIWPLNILFERLAESTLYRRHI